MKCKSRPLYASSGKRPTEEGDITIFYYLLILIAGH